MVASVAEAIGADVYDWDSTLHSHSSRLACVGFDGVHPSLQVHSHPPPPLPRTHPQVLLHRAALIPPAVRPAGPLSSSPRAPRLSHVRLQLVDMIVSDLRGSLGPKFYDTALSVSAHACTADAAMDWSHLTINLHASAGLYNLRWFSRGTDRVGSSSSNPATVLILPPSSSDPLIALPPLLLHLSHALNYTSCAATPFKILTSSHARVCISQGVEVQEGEEVAEQLCSSEYEATLRCSASPTAGGALLWRLFDGNGDDFRNSHRINQHFQAMRTLPTLLPACCVPAASGARSGRS
jgi:hypothetical protein